MQKQRKLDTKLEFDDNWLLGFYVMLLFAEISF